MVPFDKCAAAAVSLSRPRASVARALNNGAPNVERADKLVQLIARQKGLSHTSSSTPVRGVGGRTAGEQSQESRRPNRNALVAAAFSSGKGIDQSKSISGIPGLRTDRHRGAAQRLEDLCAIESGIA